MKDNKEVISEFNEYINMTASELEKWLKSEDSNSAGWPKDDGNGDGESVGHDSGRKIVEILQANPDKDPDKYTDDQLQHMRKVASYCKRHLAQEGASNKEKGPEEVKKTKSYASLKNWGHDFLKAQGQAGSERKGGSKKQKKEEGEKKEESEKKKEEGEGVEESEESKEGQEEEQKEDEDNENGGARRETRQQAAAAAAKNGTKKSNGKKQNKKDDDDMDVDEEEKEDGKEAEAKVENDDNDDEDKKTGDKRKKNGQGQDNGANKKRQTAKGKGSKKDGEEEGDDDGEEHADEDEQNGDEGGDEEEDGPKDKSSKNGPKKGDTVSWNWGNGNPKGKVLDVKEDKYVHFYPPPQYFPFLRIFSSFPFSHSGRPPLLPAFSRHQERKEKGT